MTDNGIITYRLKVAFDVFEDNMLNILIQAIGFVAMFLTITAYQYKKRKHILLSQYSGNALWCVHYLLLGTYTAVLLNLINVLRGIVFSINKKWAKGIIWAYIFSAICIAAGILTYQNWYSILPIAANVLSTWALEIKHENTLRKVYIFSVPPWIAYNALVGSISGCASSAVTMLSLIVAIVRYDRLEKKEKQAKMLDPSLTETPNADGASAPTDSASLSDAD